MIMEIYIIQKKIKALKTIHEERRFVIYITKYDWNTLAYEYKDSTRMECMVTPCFK